jgi:cobalt-zinc-cadmium efflux system membrane fusion protein
MAEATQPVEQGARLATTTPPMPTRPRRTGRGRAALLVAILLLGGILGTIAWQRLDLHPEEVQPATPAVSQPTDVVVLNEQQLQQLTIESVSERPVIVERDTTGRVSFNEERLTPIYTPYAGRVLEVLANKGTEVRPGQPLLVLEAP